MNTPNKLTLLRVFMIPIFILVYFCDSIAYNEIIAVGIYIIACITDFFDGRIARKYNLITNFGKFLDPLADKLLVNTALICFIATEDNPMPVWVVIIIISRDFIINGIRLLASDNGVVIAADYWGKIKTTFQMIMVSFLIVNIDNFVINIIEYILIYISAALTVISLIDCIIKNYKVIMSSPVEIIAETQAYDIVRKLTEAGKTITFAESCTGGLLCSSIIDIPGSSAVVKESFVTYCNESKINRIGVDSSIIEKYSDVSTETAIAMANGARLTAGADISVSVTGNAGPDIGNNDSSVGTVCIGISTEKESKAVQYNFDGNRNSVRTKAVNAALDMIVKNI